MSMKMTDPGYVFGGKYVVEEPIGRGGYGTVLRVEDQEDNQRYALKYCVGMDEDFERFKREMSILEEMRLENVITVVEAELNESPPYYVMQLAEGSLWDLAGHFRSDENTILSVFRGICNGVRGLHSKGCYHRDLKPQNILIIEGKPYVADFGCAKVQTTLTCGLTQAAMGTMEYSPPEQFEGAGARQADARSDVFALGKLLYWLYTGKSPSTIHLQQLPHHIRPIVEKATQHEKEERYQTVDTLLEVVNYYEASQLPDDSPDLDAGLKVTISAIDEQRPDADAKVRQYTARLIGRLMEVAPTYENGPEPDELMVEALDRSLPIVSEYARVVCRIAEMSSGSCAVAAYSTFGAIVDMYSEQPNSKHPLYNYSFDYQRFLGHELFTTLVACLMQLGRWEVLGEVLSEGVLVRNSDRYRMDYLGFDVISEHIVLLDHRSKRLELRRASLRADLLKERHSSGVLGEIAPIQSITDADFFLYLRSLVAKGETSLNRWRPWSVIHAMGGPDFVFRSFSKRQADRITRTLGLDDVEAYRTLLAEHGREVTRYFGNSAYWDHPISSVELKKIASM